MSCRNCGRPWGLVHVHDDCIGYECAPALDPGPAVKEAAGQALAAWASRQWRMRDIMSRPWGVFGGEVRGELLYFNAAALAEVPAE